MAWLVVAALLVFLAGFSVIVYEIVSHSND